MLSTQIPPCLIVSTVAASILMGHSAWAFVLPLHSKSPYMSRSTFVTMSSSSPVGTSDTFADAIGQMHLSLDDDACRIFHGRGECFPGYDHVTLDWFPPVLLLTSFRGVADDDFNMWRDALDARWKECFSGSDELPEMNLVYQCRADTSTTTRLVSGTVPDKHVIAENGDKYLINLLRGQNHGLFLDMANGRTWIRENSGGRNLLNLFAYTCGFSVAALSGGAKEVVNIDMAKGALKTGQKNHELNDIEPGRSRFLGHDIFKSWGKLKKLGPYDIISCDPPSYQKGSFVAKKDYAKVVRRIPQLLRPGGQALICLNAPELSIAFLTSLIESSAPELTFVKRIENPDAFLEADVDRALKVLVYELSGATSEERNNT